MTPARSAALCRTRRSLRIPPARTQCATAARIAAQWKSPVKELNIREMRASLGQLAELVAAEGELVIRRRGEPIARVLPMSQQRSRPDHADLRQRMPLLETASADLIRAERDER